MVSSDDLDRVYASTDFKRCRPCRGNKLTAAGAPCVRCGETGKVLVPAAEQRRIVALLLAEQERVATEGKAACEAGEDDDILNALRDGWRGWRDLRVRVSGLESPSLSALEVVLSRNPDGDPDYGDQLLSYGASVTPHVGATPRGDAFPESASEDVYRYD